MWRTARTLSSQSLDLEGVEVQGCTLGVGIYCDRINQPGTDWKMLRKLSSQS